jgi:hypothetical protein
LFEELIRAIVPETLNKIKNKLDIEKEKLIGDKRWTIVMQRDSKISSKKLDV